MLCDSTRRRACAFACALLALVCVLPATGAEQVRRRQHSDHVRGFLKGQRHASRTGSIRKSEESVDSGRNLRPDHLPVAYKPMIEESTADSEVGNENGAVTVSLRLSLDSVGQSYGKNTKEDILAEQMEAIERIKQVDPTVQIVGQTQLVLNAIYIRVKDHSKLTEISNDSSVRRMSPVGNYRTTLKRTVPWVGGKAVHDRFGFDGTNVTVAVLDTGIDYTHANLGGNGTLEAYEAALGVDVEDPRHKNRDGIFPTAKVVEGYDFVGEVNSGENNINIQHDDDPIDSSGHGTSVADIIAGVNGMAPGAKLIAVKVCKDGCPGLSIALGIEYAVEQKVDIINLSLGSDYGQPFDDELSLALDSATKLGILSVASAGNCGDLPYCTGTPAAAKTALSVAQTTVPGKFEPVVSFGSEDYKAAWFSWSVPVNQTDHIIEGPIQYADGAELNNTQGCEPFAEGSLNGKIVLVDRGTCYFSDKVRNIENAGGMMAIVGNNVAGAPFQGGFGGGEYPGIPAFMISLADTDAIKDVLFQRLSGEEKNVLSVDPTKFISTDNRTETTSGRGPDMSYNSIKPEIGAPGKNLAAESGTGTGEKEFSGTSGASPVVAGAAALLKQACKDCTPLALKALLMNTAFRGIKSDTTGGPAEISRIGAGELRVDQALTSTFFAYSPDDDQPSFSLGLVDVTESITIRRQIRIVNLLQEDQELRIDAMFRLGEMSDKMSIEVMNGETSSAFAVLGTCGDLVLDILFHINADAIEANHMNSGSQGENPEALSANEIDGYIVVSSQNHNDIGLPWHILARKAAKVIPSSLALNSSSPDVIDVINEGAGIAQIDVFELVAVSDEIERGPRGAEMPTPDIRAVGFRSLLAPEDECTSGFAFEFAINTWDRQAHLLPVTHYVFLDMDNDGNSDFTIWNGFSGKDSNQATTMITNMETMEETAQFYTEHATNSANTVLRGCGEHFNFNITESATKTIAVSVQAYDYLYDGPGDKVATFTIIPFGERYKNNPGIGLWSFGGSDEGGLDIAPGESGQIKIYDMGHLSFTNQNSLGAMILTNADRGEGATGAATEDTESFILLSPGVQAPQALQRNNTNPQETTGQLGTDQGTVCREAKLTASPTSAPTMSNRRSLRLANDKPTTVPVYSTAEERSLPKSRISNLRQMSVP